MSQSWAHTCIAGPTCMVPSSAANALPTRPARMMDVTTGVSSRASASASTPPTLRVRPSLANSRTNCCVVGEHEGMGQRLGRFEEWVSRGWRHGVRVCLRGGVHIVARHASCAGKGGAPVWQQRPSTHCEGADRARAHRSTRGEAAPDSPPHLYGEHHPNKACCQQRNAKRAWPHEGQLVACVAQVYLACGGKGGRDLVHGGHR